MKMIDEKGRLLGLINVVDLVILAAVVCLVGAIGWQLAGDKVSDAVSPDAEMTVVMKVAGSSPDLVAEATRQNLVGQHLVSGGVTLDAYISDMWIEDYVLSVETAEGQIVRSVDPAQKTICFEIKGKVPRDTPTPKLGSQEVRAGMTFILKTQTFSTIPIIYYMQIGE